MRDRILITGASGLLGSAIAGKFKSYSGTVLVAHNNALGAMIQTDLADPDELAALDSRDWNVLIHCAAFRDPDHCEENRASVHRLNVTATMELARISARRSAVMVFISSDYVFDGINPPYDEDSIPNPVNYYGQTKLEGEEAVRSNCPEHIIVRIPVLYGDTAGPAFSGFLENAINAVLSGQTRELDDRTTRHPTNTADVAGAIDFLLKHDFRGTVHISAQEPVTNYSWCLLVAEQLGRDTSKLTRMKDALRRKAQRPANSHLATDLYEKSGGPAISPCSEALPGLNRIKTLKEVLKENPC